MSKFKVGDEVRIVDSTSHCFKKGQVCIIESIPSYNDGEWYKLRGRGDNFGTRLVIQSLEESQFRPLTKLERALK